MARSGAVMGTKSRSEDGRAKRALGLLLGHLSKAGGLAEKVYVGRPSPITRAKPLVQDPAAQTPENTEDVAACPTLADRIRTEGVVANLGLGPSKTPVARAKSPRQDEANPVRLPTIADRTREAQRAARKKAEAEKK